MAKSQQLLSFNQKSVIEENNSSNQAQCSSSYESVAQQKTFNNAAGMSMSAIKYHKYPGLNPCSERKQVESASMRPEIIPMYKQAQLESKLFITPNNYTPFSQRNPSSGDSAA